MLVAGLALMAVALGVTLTRSPPVVVGGDFTPLNRQILETTRSERACQADETLPRGTSAIRLSLYTPFGPRVTVKVFLGGRLLTSGVRGSGWNGESPTVSVRPMSPGASHVKVCFALGRTDGDVFLFGNRARPAEDAVGEGGRPLGGRMRIEYLRSGNRTWLSQVLSVARRMGLGRWPTGTWIALFVFGLMVAIVGGAAWLTLRELP
jgi:hypothetical protein